MQENQKSETFAHRVSQKRKEISNEKSKSQSCKYQK